MRHFVLEVYRREDVEGWRVYCFGESERHTVIAEPQQIHTFPFRNGVVHVHVYDATMNRGTARAYVQAWFNGLFDTLHLSKKALTSEYNKDARHLPKY